MRTVRCLPGDADAATLELSWYSLVCMLYRVLCSRRGRRGLYGQQNAVKSPCSVLLSAALRPCLWPTVRGAAQVGSLPGALPALLDLVAAWQADRRAEPPDPGVPDPRPPDPGAAPREVAAAAARCLAQLSVHERLRPRLAVAGALTVLCAAALRAGGLAAPARPAASDGSGGDGGDAGRDNGSHMNGSSDGRGALGGRLGAAAACGVSEGGGGGQNGARQPSESEPGAPGRQDAAGFCRGSSGAGAGGAGWTPRQAPRAAPSAAHATGLALQRAAAAAVANLCGDAALAARAAEDGVAARALVALAASPDLDVQVRKGVCIGLVQGAAEDGVAARALVALAASPDLDVQVYMRASVRSAPCGPSGSPAGARACLAVRAAQHSTSSLNEISQTLADDSIGPQ